MYISTSHLQKGFKAITGVTISEYFSGRKLYSAALDIVGGEDSFSEISYRYQYESYDAFFKAFKKFHGYSPSEIKRNPSKIRRYPPLKIKITVQGGDELIFREVTLEEFDIYGDQHTIAFDRREKDAPQLFYKYVSKMAPKENAEVFSVITDNGDSFSYFIGTKQNQMEVLEKYRIPSGTWLVFPCEGKHPEVLRETRSRLFNEFLVVHPEYELVGKIIVERFINGDYRSHYYKSELWVPVRHNDV